MDLANATHLTPADRIIGALTFASGAADVFAFTQFHEIFTSAMTGNTALLGLALGRGHLLAAARALAALAGFGLGGIAGALIGDAGTPPPASRVRRLLAVEIAILAVVALFWIVLPHPVYHAPLYALIVAAAAAMGVQSVAARVIDLPGLPTVVFTSTLTMILIALARGLRALVRRDKDAERLPPITARQSAAMALYIAGAAVSGALASALPIVIAIPPLGAALLARAAAAEYATKA
ncbi:MAG: YoaK family protein [Acidiphilium sp.]